MNHDAIIHSLVIIISILGVLLVSKKLTGFKIPLPISLIVITFVIYAFAPHLVDISSSSNFDLILLSLLPLILLPDALKLSWVDLKKHGLSIFYLAVIAVALSIIMGISLKFVMFQEYMLSTGAFISLMAMVLATDAISVTNIFNQFKLPHSLKVLTEGESLTNDATAVIAYYFIGIPLLAGGSVSVTSIGIDIIRVVSLSSLIGFVVGGLFFLLMFIFHDSLEELFLIMMTTYTAFTIAEVFKLSSILSLIVAVVVFKTALLNNLKNFDETSNESNQDDGFFSFFKKKSPHSASNIKGKKFSKSYFATTDIKLRYNEEIIESFAIIATAVLFFSLAELINFNNILIYWKEILIVFVATTFIRALMMLKFSLLTNKTTKMHNVNMRWWGVLTFSGIKGGLSLIMVHNIPATFQYKAMFETVVIGVILLSIFVYSIALIALIHKYKKDFEIEYQQELAQSH